MKKGGYILEKRIHLCLLFAVFLCFLIFIPNAFATPMAGDKIVLTRTGVGGATTGGGEFLATVTHAGSAAKDQPVLVTEPATLLLSGLGLIFTGVFFRRKFIK